MADNDAKCLVWNEKNPKLINIKFIENEELVEKPIHTSMN